MGGRRTALILRLALHTPPSSRTAGTVGLFSRRFGGRRERARSSLALGTKAAHAVLGRSRSPLGMTQSIIDSMYNTLLRDTLGQVDARILLPAEQCYLLRGHHLPREASLSINATSCKEAVEADAGRRQQLGRKFSRNQTSHGSLLAASIVARGTNSLPCWQTAAVTDAASACPNSGHGRGDALPLARRLSLIGRHSATAALSNESHLVRAETLRVRARLCCSVTQSWVTCLNP